MNTNELILKMAGQKVSEALKGAEMIKEVPAQTMSVIQDEIDPETVELIEQLLGNEKSAEVKIIDNTKRFDVITDTVGNLARPINAVLTMETAPITNFTDKNTEKLKDVVNDFVQKHPDEEDVTVYIGDTPSISESVSYILDKDTSIPDATLRALSMPTQLFSKVLRSSHFNPIDRSIAIYDPSESSIRHELGHATVNSQVFGKNPLTHAMADAFKIYAKGVPILEPVRLADEVMASGTAQKSILDQDKSSQINMGRSLGAALGTYGGGAVADLITGLVNKKDLARNYPALKKFLEGNLIDTNIGKKHLQLLPYPIVAGSIIGGLAGTLLGDKVTLPGFSPKTEGDTKTTVIIEKDIKEAALKKIAASGGGPSPVPGFHASMADIMDKTLENIGGSYNQVWGPNGSGVGKSFSSGLRDFGRSIFDGYKPPPGGSTMGLTTALRNTAKTMFHHPGTTAAYGLGAAGLGALGLYGIHKMLD